MLLCESTWKQGLKQYYGASATSKWHQLAMDIECVAMGLKPAYLLDILSPKPSLFHSLLNYVLCKTLEKSDPHSLVVIQRSLGELRVVDLGNDVLLINKTAVEELLRGSCVCIDISRTKKPRHEQPPDAHINIHHSSDVEEQLRRWYSALLASELQITKSAFCSKSEDRATSVMLLSVPPQPELNLCTLFGRLLGYPVVYWFPPSTDYSLDLVELSIHQVTLPKNTLSKCSPEKVYSYISYNVICHATCNLPL